MKHNYGKKDMLYPLQLLFSVIKHEKKDAKIVIFGVYRISGAENMLLY